jgi:general transcription factor 3C polypeptide 5 (transcription factor C subunit 1)
MCVCVTASLPRCSEQKGKGRYKWTDWHDWHDWHSHHRLMQMANHQATTVSLPPADASEPAPRLPIPTRAISAVEHPCIIKNIDKGIISLGGPVKLSQSLRSELQLKRNAEGDEVPPNVVTASLRPDDPCAKRLLSTTVTTNNLLLKVTVPKRTGRRRKRGSSGPFVADSNEHQDGPKQNTHVPASSIFRRLQDNASKYTVSVAGLIDETHRFRTLPDLQYAATTNKTMTDVRDKILPFNYGKLMSYDFKNAAGVNLTRGVGPSAWFIQMPIAYSYRFQQNTHVKYTGEGGETNIQRSIAYKSYSIIKPDAETVPQGPNPNLPPESELSSYTQSLIANIRLELQKRPIITRHLLFNTLGWDTRTRLRQAAVYCGYFFETGPWREALITWGLDPRSDPRFRHYQTVSFLSYLKTGTPRHFTAFDKHVQTLAHADPAWLKNQHTFDGVHVSMTGNLFQFCDITDPLIRRILDTDDIRSTCAPTLQGWYHIGTWAKATVIVKDKMNRILGGEQPDNSLYERVAAWPEVWDDDEMTAMLKPEMHDKEIRKEKAGEHNVMRHVRWAARNPRYAFEKMEAASAQKGSQANNADPREETEEEQEEEVVPEDMTEEPDTAVTILNEGDEEEEDDEDVEDDEDGDDDEGGLDEDMDAEGETDDEQVPYRERESSHDSDELEPVVRAETEGPLPFGGLFNA